MADWDYVLRADIRTTPLWQFVMEDRRRPDFDSIHQMYYYVAVAYIEDLLQQLKGTDTRNLKVQICTSKLVASQVMGKWRVNDSVLFMLCAKVRALLSEFGQWEAVCKEGE